MQPTTEALAEIAIFFAAQTGMLIWILSDMRAELRNLKDRLAYTNVRGDDNGRSLANLEGQFQEHERFPR